MNDIVEGIRQTILKNEDTLTDYIAEEANKYNEDELQLIRDKSRWMITNDKWQDTYSAINLMLNQK
jgi:hypothetical protein